MNNTLSESIGNEAKRARSELHMSVEQVSERIGMTPEMYHSIEQGKTLPSVLIFARLASSIGADPHAMLGGDMPLKPWLFDKCGE